MVHLFIPSAAAWSRPRLYRLVQRHAATFFGQAEAETCADRSVCATMATASNPVLS